MRDPLLKVHVGPHHYSQDGGELLVLLLPMRSLMGKGDEGCEVLCGLRLRVRFRWPWGLRLWPAVISYGDTHGWRSPLSFNLRSDVDEIATRRAQLGNAGHGR